MLPNISILNTSVRAISHTLLLLSLSVAFAGNALAHVSEQGFVLLLPTGIYITSGVAVVIMTLIALALIPARVSHALFTSIPLIRIPGTHWPKIASSCLSLFVFALLLYIGLSGTNDPLKNLLPLSVWTVLWIGIVVIQGLIGDVWAWINPWSGPLWVINAATGRSNGKSNIQPTVIHAIGLQSSEIAEELPSWQRVLGCWPACALLLLFAWFTLADPAPDTPSRLAIIAACYWFLSFMGMWFLGEQYWTRCFEFFSVLMRQFGSLAFFVRRDAGIRLGIQGFRMLHSLTTESMEHAPGLLRGTGVFALLLLAIGSFDGLNETFWWLSVIGINPLDFPGRSAVIRETTLGLVLLFGLLIAIFGTCVWVGMRLVKPSLLPNSKMPGYSTAFGSLALTLLPIAFAYHIAHYLTAFMVNIQYVVVAISDPLNHGSDWLGLGQFYVTTGFLNHHHTVELIWLAQAGVVVFGHVISVLLAHAVAVHLFGSTRRAVLSQLPLASFMVLYTFLGLWLLASPKGA